MLRESNENIFFNWLNIQSDTIEYLLISGAPYWDVIELISTTVTFVNGGMWYSTDARELVI